VFAGKLNADSHLSARKLAVSVGTVTLPVCEC
jgi:hypothetical protein